MADELTPGLKAPGAKDVFISYASQDKVVAEAVCKALEGAGLACWIAPRDVTPGESFAGAIVHAIDSTKVIVLVLSEHAADSQHVLREVERAASKRHAIIAFRLDMKPLPADFEYFLNTSQWLDAGTTGVRRALPKLLEAVRGATAHASTAPGVMPAPTVAPVANKRWRPALVATLALVLAVAAYLLIDRFLVSKPVTAPTLAASTNRPPELSQKSIAVLPFVDMSEKHDQEYFSDGLSEELIDHLAHFADLKVIARTSSFAFKGKNEDMRSIASKLGVANLLEGSVRKTGSTLRITAQLIQASDGMHLWSEIYDRKIADIFKVQDEISTTVAKALNAALHAGSVAEGQPESRGTTNIEAYNLFLQGNFYFWRGDSGDVAKSVEFLKQALKLDSRYATAWARLARAYAYQGISGELTGAEAEARARDAVQRALAIDPNCAEAYFARGNIFSQILGDWTAAKSDYRRAVALDPHGEIGERAQMVSQLYEASLDDSYGKAIAVRRRALERSPLDTDSISFVAYFQYLNGQLAESAATSRKLLELNPAYSTGQAQYGLTLLIMGKKSEALAATQKESDEATKLVTLACVYWAMGRRTESDSALNTLQRGFADRDAYGIAQVHAYRGEVDAAFMRLARADQTLRASLIDMKADPLLRNLHGDPRFDALLRKVKLVE